MNLLGLQDDDLIDMAFNTKKADARKEPCARFGEAYSTARTLTMPTCLFTCGCMLPGQITSRGRE